MKSGFDRAIKLAAERQAGRRSFNARLAAVDLPDPEAGVMSFRCECALIGCSAAIKMTAPEYADLRAHPLHFAALPEHVMPEAETVIATHRGWAIVEKHPGPGAEIAARTFSEDGAAAARERASAPHNGRP